MARSKKEIDKELMYKKLMPTANVAADNIEQPESENAAKSVVSQPVPAAAPAVSAPVQPPAAPSVSAPSGVPAAENVPSPLPSAAAAIISGSVPEPQGEVVNVMELMVNARIAAAMEKFRCCTCDKCKKDVTAITLNKLIPCYILSTDDAKRIEAEAKFAGQVATGIVQAILTVKARPTHD